MRRVILLFLLLFSGYALDLVGHVEKTTFVVNDTLVVCGSVDQEVNATLALYSGSSLINYTTKPVNGTFNLSLKLDVPPAVYVAKLSAGGKEIDFTINVLPEELFYITFLIPSSQDFFEISTPFKITAGDEYGGNFSDLLALSLSGEIFMGNDTNATYVIVDPRNAGDYEVVFKDDDRLFLLYNDTEDTTGKVEKSRRLWDVIDNFVIPYIDRSGFFFAKAIESPDYAPGSDVHFVVITTNASGRVSRQVKVSLTDVEGNSYGSQLITTNARGYANVTMKVPSKPGDYFITVNGIPTERISVRNFNLFLDITDESGNSRREFRPTGVVKFVLSGKSGGNPVLLSSALVRAFYPDGTIITLSPEKEGSLYVAKLDLNGLPAGDYGVEAEAAYGGETQKVKDGFSVVNFKAEAEAINLEFVEQFFVTNTFGIGKNVTILVMLRDLSKPLTPEPCAMGSCIPMEDTNGTCADRVKVEKIVNEYGHEVLFPRITVVNVSKASQMFGFSAPPEGLKEQCVVIIQTVNQTGDYRAILSLAHPSYQGKVDAVFSLKRLIAFGEPVDSEGNEFGFFKPGGVVRIRLKVKDLTTDNFIPGTQIFNPRIVEINQLYPSFVDMLESGLYNKSVANESIQYIGEDAVLTFTAPSQEGFYEVKFRFKANLSGGVVDGEGSAFISLKRYFISAYPTDLFSPGENVTLIVSVVDADSAAWGGTCTGCEGLVANITKLRNEQTGKVYRNVKFTSTAINGTGNTITVVIDTSGMDPGWYSVELEVYDPETPSVKYMGWGGFELRNFWVRVIPVKRADGNYTLSGEQFSNFDRFYLAVILDTPQGPAVPESVELVSFGMEGFGMVVEQPVTLLNITSGLVCEKGCFPAKILELSSPDAPDGYYRVSVRAVYQGVSDIGTAFLQKVSFFVKIKLYPEERAFRWPIRYSSSEKFFATFIAFNETGENKLKNVTIAHVFSEKEGRPIKFEYGSNYTTFCSGNQCNITFNLTGFSGRYHIEFEVEDYANRTTRQGIDIEMKNYLLSIPKLIELGGGAEIPTKREFELWNTEDNCFNEIWLAPDSCPGQNSTVCITQGVMEVNITLPVNKTSSQYFGGLFKVVNSSEPWRYGRWEPGDSPAPGPGVFLVTNGTHYWVGGSSDLSSEPTRKVGTDTFQVTGFDINWNVSAKTGESRVVVDGDVVCGFFSICNSTGCRDYPMEVVPPAYSGKEIYFGGAELYEKEPLFYELPACAPHFVFVAFHNKTHAWLGAANITGAIVRANLSTAPAVEGGVVSLNGSQWEIYRIDVNKIGLRAIDRLFTGYYVNANLSKSGKIRMSYVSEEWISGREEFEAGADLNGNGARNDTFAFFLIDNSTAGVYDVFAIALQNPCNASAVVNVNSDRASRKIGNPDTLVLLSIGSRGERVLLYSDKPGEWPWLGEVSSTGKFRIPLLITMPNGTLVEANVSVIGARKIGEEKDVFIDIPDQNASINGAGEIEMNASLLGSGFFALNVIANISGEIVKMEDWQWPLVQVRTFFAQPEFGKGAYVSGLQPVKVYESGWAVIFPSYSSGTVFFVDENSYIGSEPLSCNFKMPPDANRSGANHTYALPEDYYLYENSGNASKVWIKKGDCDFSSVTALSEGDAYNFTISGNVIVLRILNATINMTHIGLAGFNVPPARAFDWGWALVGLNMSGKVLDFLIVNKSAGLCSAWGMNSCGGGVYVDDDGNFSDAVEVSVGQEIPLLPGYYLQFVDFWGNWIKIANASFVTDRGTDGLVYYGKFDENWLGTDLDGDGEMENISIMLFDDIPDKKLELENILIDDDEQLIPWFGVYNETLMKNIPYDYEKEKGTEEMWGNLPREGWYGWVGGENASWNIPLATNTSLVFLNWWTLDPATDRDAMLAVRITDYYGNPVVGANVSIEKIRFYGTYTKQLEEGNDYNVTAILNQTDELGYAIFKIEVNSWERGSYKAVLNVTYGGISDLVETWFGVW